MYVIILVNELLKSKLLNIIDYILYKKLIHVYFIKCTFFFKKKINISLGREEI